MRIIVSGSLAYDIILDFGGLFAEHIRPEKVHSLSLSFLIRGVKQSVGGTAANIAYNLGLLGLDVVVVGTLGRDGGDAARNLKKQGVDTSALSVSKRLATAKAFIMTDRSDSQIAAFYPGAMAEAVRKPKLEPCDWPIIAAENPKNMVTLARHYQSTLHRYIFDPGQQSIALSAAQMRICAKGASVIIGNDYEMDFVLKKLGRKPGAVLIRTLGPKGSEVIYPNGKKEKIGVAKVSKTVDPTGAGDAYRAGFIKGVVLGLPVRLAAQLGATAAAFAVERLGTQNHRFGYDILKARHNRNFKDKI